METLSTTEIGEIIKFFRKNRGLTQFELVELVGIDDKQIGKIERGVHFPSVPTFLKLINVLKINIKGFYTNADVQKMLSIVRTLSPKQANMAYEIINVISKY